MWSRFWGTPRVYNIICIRLFNITDDVRKRFHAVLLLAVCIYLYTTSFVPVRPPNPNRPAAERTAVNYFNETRARIQLSMSSCQMFSAKTFERSATLLCTIRVYTQQVYTAAHMTARHKQASHDVCVVYITCFFFSSTERFYSIFVYRCKFFLLINFFISTSCRNGPK